ncbi:helix-turn-helix domain-containing protein [Nocardia sp. CNY236]|uniref:helix-turn-helix domain-containing protein n=1 Tax=Nocardia sp. CNY236 TaxID=1169152 RepID=UPI00041578AF|nr:helix-turn-helix transcriptional regulator [Nocardia sp. CNY236]
MDTSTVGDLLRHWRLERRLSQLELAGRADTSARHLSFIETGRAKPSRTMIAHLAEHLEIPLRERNRVLLAAGYAPAYTQPAWDTPAMDAIRSAMRRILAGHEPYPALAIDQNWTMVDANSGVTTLLEGVDPALIAAPMNALRVSLHPDGMAGRIRNLAEWRGHVFARLTRQAEVTRSQQLVDLLEELRSYPGGEVQLTLPEPDQAVVPLVIEHAGAPLSLLSVTTVFGSPMNVTVAELAIESFLPADEDTMRRLTADSR